MKKIILATIIVVLTAFPAFADNASSLCEPKWGTNYTMLEHCINSQNEAEAELGLWYSETGEWDIFSSNYASGSVDSGFRDYL